MAVTYRTTGAWGTGKGAPLTDVEVDTNFWTLVQDVAAKAVQGVGIANFVVSGNQLTVVLTDHTLLGPYTLPTAAITFRGTWAAPVAYFVNDIFIHNGTVYIVRINHTSVSPFDPGANDGNGHQFYAVLLENPGAELPAGGATGAVLTKSTSVDYAVTWDLPTLQGLFDVVQSPGPSIGDTVIWNGTLFEYGDPTPTPPALSSLTDVTISGQTNGQVLEWNAGASRWENASLGTMAAQNANAVAITGGTVTGLPTPSASSDAATKSYVDGSISGFGSVASGFLVANIAGTSQPPAGVSLNAFLDFVFGGSPAQGTIIFRNATGWVALSPGAAGTVLTSGGSGANIAWAMDSVALGSLSDVTIMSLATDDILVYNGSQWQNERAKYVVACYAPGLLTASQSLLYHRFSKAVTFPANLGAYLGHQTEGGASVAATGSTTFTLQKATAASPTSFSNVGTVVYSSASAVNTSLTTSGGAPVGFAQGDILRIVGPNPADVTLSDVHMTLVGFET